MSLSENQLHVSNYDLLMDDYEYYSYASTREERLLLALEIREEEEREQAPR